MTNLVVRPATADDIGALIALDSFAAPDNDRAAEIAEWVHSAHCFCAELNGILVAYSVLHQHFFHRPMLEMLMVGIDFRRQGIGELMIEHAIKATAHELWTSTNQSNQAMQSLLERMGFQRCGIIEELDEGDPELIYRHTAKRSS